MINKITIVGRLVDDPELRYTPNGKPVANFKIASSRPYKDSNTGERPTDFPMVVVWGKDGEFIANNGKKGAMVALSGRLETRSYDHAQHPIKVYVTEINADEVQLLDWNDNGQGGQRNNNSNQGNQSSYGNNRSGGGNYGNNNNNQGGYGQGGGNNQSGQRSNSGYGSNSSGYGGNSGGYGGNQGGQNSGYNEGAHYKGGKTIDINDDDLPF